MDFLKSPRYDRKDTKRSQGFFQFGLAKNENSKQIGV